MNAIHHFGMHRLGGKFRQALAQMIDVGIWQVTHIAKLGVFRQLTEAQLSKADCRQGQQAGGTFDNQVIKM